MSWWTYVRGVVAVEPMGRTQPERRYILDTILEHLPLVTGSEENMQVYVMQRAGDDESSSHDEFGEMTNNLIDRYGNKGNHSMGWQRLQSTYFLVVDGSLRDRVFNTTMREFQKWLCRLAKRVCIKTVLVSIDGYDQHATLNYTDSLDNPYYQMFEEPSWCNDSGEPTWCEYLMWGRGIDTAYPLQLEYKYFDNKKNDEEYERRVRR